jgi:RNA polymerase sigma-70 factor (ECF subfamily)
MGVPLARRPDSPNGSVAPSVSALLRRVRVGDVEAFRELYLMLYRRLWGFAYGIVRSEVMADDILQDVFADFWERRAELVVRQSLDVYLYGAVRHRALNLLRHNRVAQRTGDELQPDEDVIPGLGTAEMQPDEAVQLTDLQEAVERTVLALPLAQRQVVLLHWRHGLSNGEIAQTMGISIGAVAVLLSRARTTLRKTLGSHLE